MFGVIYAFSGLIKFFTAGENKKQLSLLIDEKYKGPLVSGEHWAPLLRVGFEVGQFHRESGQNGKLGYRQSSNILRQFLQSKRSCRYECRISCKRCRISHL